MNTTSWRNLIWLTLDLRNQLIHHFIIKLFQVNGPLIYPNKTQKTPEVQARICLL